MEIIILIYVYNFSLSNREIPPRMITGYMIVPLASLSIFREFLSSFSFSRSRAFAPLPLSKVE